MHFYDRKTELKELERVWKLSHKTTHLTLIVGRRRVGKTELVKEFFKGKKEHLYFFIGRKNMNLLMEEITALAKEKIPDFPTVVHFDEWLLYLLQHIKAGTVICFDEFQNFKYIDEAVFSDFQKVFDGAKNKTAANIIVTGSYISLINKLFSDSKQPLFGRVTERYNLKPLDFLTVCDILNDFDIKSMKEKITWYSVFGGVPKYYVIAEEQGLAGKDIFSAFQLLLFRDFAPLREEASSILIEEFGSEHSIYFSILEAVALGNNEMTTIANKTGINIKSISKYLALLVKEYCYLSYDVPITEEKPWKSKKGRYFLRDPFLRFWFAYIYRNRSIYEIANYTALLQRVKENFDSFVGYGYEEVAKETLVRLNAEGKLLTSFSRIGKWWARDQEIDVIGLNDKTREILFVEVKWKENVDALEIIEALKRKTEHVPWHKGERKEYFAVFAKSFKNKTKQKGVLLFDLDNF